MNTELAVSSLLRSYRNGTLTPRDFLTKQLEKCASAPESIWISRISGEMLEACLKRLESVSPECLPLYGIPFAVKDNIDLAGLPTTAACPEFRYLPERSAKAVELLIEAGAVPLGKTNMDQFATGLVGVRSPYGAVPNRLAPGYISGGSSSGSAAALAYGLCSFALGTDTAGSGRVPAAFNNLTGLKPSRGMLSTNGVVPACRTLDSVSIFAFSAEDASLVFDVAAQYDPDDPYSRRRGEDVRLPLKWTFGVPREDQLRFFGNGDYEAAFESAVKRLEAAGGIKKEIDFSPFQEAALLLYEGPWVYERYASVGKFIEEHPGAVLPVIRRIIVPEKTMHPSDVFNAMYRLQALKVRAGRELAKADVLVTPTAGTCYRTGEVLADPVRLNSNLGYYTNYMNLLDYSAIAVPAGFAGPLPFGITLVADAFCDFKLLELAGKLEPVFQKTVRLAVCGAHLSGEPLHGQLADAVFVGAGRTAPEYKMFALQDGFPEKPALVHTPADGTDFYVEIYELSTEEFGAFTASVPAPLAIGKVKLADGSAVSGFVGEHEVCRGRDISAFGDWRKYRRETGR